MRSSLSFKIEAHDSGALSITPCIDGTPLPDLIASYEELYGFQPVGGYAGLTPAYFRYGPLDQYFLGRPDDPAPWVRIGGVYVLSCICGEAGCWPLKCRIELNESTVVWSDFRQPHRPDRDYSRFGPFLFTRTDYELALAGLPKE